MIFFQSTTVVFLKYGHFRCMDSSCAANTEGQTPSDRSSALITPHFGQRNQSDQDLQMLCFGMTALNPNKAQQIHLRSDSRALRNCLTAAQAEC